MGSTLRTASMVFPKYMKPIQAVVVAVSAQAILAASAGAQALPGDGWLLPPGTLRFGVAMDYSHFDSRFGAGGTEPWSADLAGPLDATTFAPLGPVRTGLEAFFAATGGGPAVDAGALTLGDIALDLSADTRWVPFELSLGVLPRLEIGVRLPIFRSEVQVSRFDLAGGTVGANPAPDANAAALAGFGAEFGALGRSPLLPLEGSTLGAALTARVAAAGGEIFLPTDAAGDSLLNALLMSELGRPPIATHREPWRVGDARAHARIRLVSTMGADPFPTDSGPLHYRLSATLGARLPTGTEPDTVRLFTPSPSVGLMGWSAGIGGDLFVGSRVWVAASAGYSATSPVDVLRRVTDPERPLVSADPPQVVRWSPPTELRIRISPRWRLEESLSVGVDYEMLTTGASAYDGEAEVLNASGGSAQRLGGSARFSTLPGYGPDGGLIPFEAVLAYSRTLAGPDGYPRATTLAVGARVYHPLWGRARRP